MKKLTIQAYKDRKRKGASIGKIEVAVNPESVTTRHEHMYSRYRGINSSKNTATYTHSLAEEFTFQLVMVEASAMDYGPTALIGDSKSVSQQIAEFMEVCYLMNGSIHESNFLNVRWGEVNFDCKLKALDIKYTSFDREGNPRRAELDVIFVEDISRENAARLEGKSSPDLTHIVTVKEGDTLPLLTGKVYGVSNKSLYLQVARVNNLNDFRNLKRGQQIFFPPLQK